jgi:predicted GH43/DUF377 family glycosyl hydrolase
VDIFEKYNSDPCAATATQIANHFYISGQHQLAALFALKAVEHHSKVKSTLLPDCAKALEILSISSFYTKPDIKKVGHLAAEMLSTSPSVDWDTVSLARKNLVFYTKQLYEIAEVTRKKKLEIPLKHWWVLLNPSVVTWNDELYLVQRSTNYRIIDGAYITPNNDPITTENWLLSLDKHTLDIKSIDQIHEPDNWPAPLYKDVIGIEDCRAAVFDGELRISATVRELNQQGMCQILTGSILKNEDRTEIVNWKIQNHIRPEQHQKNWMPIIDHPEYRFVYLTDPTVVIDHSMNLKALPERRRIYDCTNHRGGSQVIPFDDGWLCITHEVEFDGRVRNYVHRFVQFSKEFQITHVSERFKLSEHGIEFVAGLTWNHDNTSLIISAGIRDCESWLIEVRAQEVERLLKSNGLAPYRFVKAAGLYQN